MKSVLIIDDDYRMKSYAEKFIAGFVVEQIYRLPDDELVLQKYDALIVDGQGISNGKYRNGLEFCKAYYEGFARVHTKDGSIHEAFYCETYKQWIPREKYRGDANNWSIVPDWIVKIEEAK